MKQTVFGEVKRAVDCFGKFKDFPGCQKCNFLHDCKKYTNGDLEIEK
jgi:hypothetical protein